jgi:hypothetical protein
MMEKITGTDRVKIEGGKENRSYNKRKFNWIGSIFPTNCLLKHFIEGNLERGIEVTGRRGRKHKHLPDGLQKTKISWKLREERVDRSRWETRCGRLWARLTTM